MEEKRREHEWIALLLLGISGAFFVAAALWGRDLLLLAIPFFLMGVTIWPWLRR